MGKADNGAGRPDGKNRKNKARMSYLKQTRRGQGGWGRGGGGGGREGNGDGPSSNRGAEDSSGGYVSAYGRGGGRGYHQQNRSRRPRTELAPGMKGFICTTGFRESDCVREAYNLLNEYHEREDGQLGKSTSRMELESKPLVLSTKEKDAGSGNSIAEESKNSTEGDKKLEETETEDAEGIRIFCREEQEAAVDKGTPASKPSLDDDSDSDLDINEQIKREIAELKSDPVRKRFQCVDSGVKNVVFISSTIEDPNEIVYRLFEDVVSTKTAKARYILRFLPILGTCHADTNAIQKLCKEIFEKDFKEGYKSFKIVVNIRSHSKMNRGDIITTVANMVSEVSPLNFVDLTNPMITITAEVLKTVFCLSVVKDFNRFKKFNLSEACQEDKPEKVDGNQDNKEQVLAEEKEAKMEILESEVSENTDVKVDEDNTPGAKASEILTPPKNDSDNAKQSDKTDN